MGGPLLPRVCCFPPLVGNDEARIYGLAYPPISSAAAFFCQQVAPPVPGAQLVDTFLGKLYDIAVDVSSFTLPPIFTGDMLKESARVAICAAYSSSSSCFNPVAT